MMSEDSSVTSFALAIVERILIEESPSGPSQREALLMWEGGRDALSGELTLHADHRRMLGESTFGGVVALQVTMNVLRDRGITDTTSVLREVLQQISQIV